MNKKQDLDAEKKIVEQHKKDVLKVIEDIKTIPCNIDLQTDQTWEDIKKVRTKHCESYLKILEAQEKQFIHFQ